MTPQEFCVWLDKYLTNNGKDLNKIEDTLNKVAIYDAPIKTTMPPNSASGSNYVTKGFH